MTTIPQYEAQITQTTDPQRLKEVFNRLDRDYPAYTFRALADRARQEGSITLADRYVALADDVLRGGR
jgi:hypothetical protein